MLPQLRYTIRDLAHSFTRPHPHAIRTLTSIISESPTATSAPPDPPLTSLDPTPSQTAAAAAAAAAYAFPSAASEIQPTLDIPPESDPLLAYLTSHLMRDGKRHAAARRTSRMLLHLHALTRSPPLPIFRQAVALASPSVRVVSHKKGGKSIQKPVPLGEKQRTRFAIEWMLEAADKRRGRTVEERLAKEVLEIIKGTQADNEVLKKKYDIHRLGMVNRANAKSRA